MIEWIAQRKHQLSIFLIWLFSISGIIGILLGYGDWFLPKTPLNLLVLGLLLIWNYPIQNKVTVGIFIFSFLVGMIVEIVGVKTGIIFGQYYYGQNLGPKLMGVPYFIGWNWAFMSFACAAIGRYFFKNIFLAMTSGALLMVLFDVILEAVADDLDFWYWVSDVVPLQNYVTWFLVSFFLQWVIHLFAKSTDYKYSLNLLISQFLFLMSCFFLLN